MSYIPSQMSRIESSNCRERDCALAGASSRRHRSCQISTSAAYPYDENADDNDTSSVVEKWSSHQEKEDGNEPKNPIRSLLDAFACLCVGVGSRGTMDLHEDDPIDNGEVHQHPPLNRPIYTCCTKTPAAESPRGVADHDLALLSPTKPVHQRSSMNNNSKNKNKNNTPQPASFIIRPKACVTDHCDETELFRNQYYKQEGKRRSTYPSSRYMFRPVSEDESSIAFTNHNNNNNNSSSSSSSTAEKSRGWEV